MTYRYTTVRDFIRSCVEDRKIKNPHYTTSAFAKRIGLSAAMLTEVLKGRKFLSKERCYVVSRELKLCEAETEYLALLAEFETAKDIDLKSSLEKRIRAITHSAQKNDASYFISETFAVSSDGLEQIRSLAERFLNEVTAISNECATHDQACQIGVQLFQVSNQVRSLSIADSERVEDVQSPSSRVASEAERENVAREIF